MTTNTTDPIENEDEYLPPGWFRRRRMSLARRLALAVRGTAVVVLVAAMVALMALDLSIYFAPYKTEIVLHEARTELFGQDYRIVSANWHDPEE